MTDEPDDDDFGEVEASEPTESEVYEVEDGIIIFPHGSQWFAETYDFSAIRVRMSTREIEGMGCEDGKWRKPSQGKSTAEIRAIRNEPDAKG